MRRLALALALVVLPAEADDRRSGFDVMGPDTQAMQQDDTANPGILWVRDGEALWTRADGGKSCAACHGAVESMRGAAARYPVFDGAPLSLEQRINRCRTTHQGATPLAYESQELLALTAVVAHQSRGLPITPDADPHLGAVRAEGERLFRQRQGQLDLACSQCHDDNAGKRLAGNLIPQGHPTGYPVYRLEWQGMGSLQRRLRNCQGAVRAEPYAYGSAELVALEAYLMARAGGMPLETPAVRP
ncbi:sulfur oxidation c-type cytochrome SoxA [Azospirillum sp. TSO22-1]|uniref:sulfur oxidation c-type cytochrome SoxA n=1 Tax=Azospirillum sp. TSO22-1 TaxID=716789 RepID=UPI000D60A9B1|nr:sulfur oxidation c-type cytochrome SoxA [Azospirillum sp. TSO22-1]PWC31727.1 cytochrome C [Azospirillum sp. TSO22-1]